MDYFLEYGYTSLNHVGEELCGDKVEYCRNGNFLTIVLADGLGSGVKANILSTLTSKILCTMMSNDVPINECLSTIVASLPVCKTRSVAYSTFSVIHVDNQGHGYLIEFDNPQAIYLRNGKYLDLERESLFIENKTIYKTNLSMDKDDLIFIMSDGAIHAGIGNTLNFGWERTEIISYLEENYQSKLSSRAMACQLAYACNALYGEKPGDDTTIAAIKFKEAIRANIMIGPPVDPNKDDFYVSKFLTDADKKVVCGGTTSKIVSRYLKTDVVSSFEFYDPDVPPIGFIDGIDLTTEGVLTIRKLLALSEKYVSSNDLDKKYYDGLDGASLLAQLLFEEATHITFYVGQNINAAHLGLPIDITMKMKLVDSLANNLKEMGKNVIVNYV